MSETETFFIIRMDTRNQISNSGYYNITMNFVK